MGISSFGWFGIYSAALLLGIAHALEPGHGKTVVAAYLVGSKGRSIDALILGLTVTFTHTFSIIVLGIIAKMSAKYYTEQQIHGWLGIVASLIILVIGIWMIKVRWSALGDPSAAHHHLHLFGGHDHDHGHPHPKGHSHSHATDTAAAHAHDHATDDHHHAHDHDPVAALHAHNHAQAAAHTHDHAADDHSHEHGHVHDAHDHGHLHQGDAHHHALPASPPENNSVGLPALIMLGISGGIVPCPAALAILLASASVGNLGKGLFLVVVFSFGLALSLVAIGLVIVSGVRGAQRFVDTDKYAPRVAFASALIVTAVGAYTLYSSLGHLGVV